MAIQITDDQGRSSEMRFQGSGMRECQAWSDAVAEAARRSRKPDITTQVGVSLPRRRGAWTSLDTQTCMSQVEAERKTRKAEKARSLALRQHVSELITCVCQPPSADCVLCVVLRVTWYRTLNDDTQRTGWLVNALMSSSKAKRKEKKIIKRNETHFLQSTGLRDIAMGP